MDIGYPRVEINLKYVEENAAEIVRRCHEQGVMVTGVIKGANGIPQVTKAFVDGGIDIIGTSRLEQIAEARAFGVEAPMMYIRMPMLTEVEDVVELADYSLNTEIVVIRALNEAAKKQGKVHKIILMYDVGDLREGYYDVDELVEVSREIEEDLDNLYLAGVGMNVGCYGSILPTIDKLEQLIAAAEKIEAKIGRKLDIISGGASMSLQRIWDRNMPERINHLRIGGEIMMNFTNRVIFGYDTSPMHGDAFKLKAEIIEVKTKPSYPQGKIAIDAFGHTPEYVDRGMRKRALLAIGKVDYQDTGYLLLEEPGVEILGASSDHTILDIEDAEKDYKVGDIIEFPMRYSCMVYTTKSPNVKIKFV